MKKVNAVALGMSPILLDNFLIMPYNCKRIFQRKWGENPPLTRNCDWEDSAVYGHWETGKAGGIIAHKPGNFGVQASVGSTGLVWAPLSFFRLRR
jgi:hypothetical protein